MPFEKVDPVADFPAQERAILQFWDAQGIFDKLRAKNAGKPRWSFLDGPITANNPMGVHHAWGRTYKDAYQRYHAMLGRELRYQNGFDCQGLWVEVEVEKALKLSSKREIENLVPGDRDASIASFVQQCKGRVDQYARVQTEQSIRLGYWMDWDRTDADWAKPPGERKSYFTMSERNNYTIWSFLKKCHGRGLVYRGFDAMPWCPRCGVGISQMEMNEGYRVVAHRAVFLRLPLRDRPGENLLAWTTTPWTLTSNVAAAVNPELLYLKVRQGDQIYYVGKGAFTAKRKDEEFKDKAQWIEGVPKLKSLEQLFKEKKGGFEILDELKGEQLVGWTYDGPFDEFEAPNEPGGSPRDLAEVAERQGWTSSQASAREAHRVVAWAEVSEAEGTGIVHIAPGCGAEDFALGKAAGLPPVAPLGEDGRYLPGFGELTGRLAVDPDVADWVIAQLGERCLLFATEKYPHRYPHCWRCKTELLYRLVDEWFISMSWRDEIVRTLDDVTWLPASINGHAREKNWLDSMGDWMISKKRFWGLALPIWVDAETGDFEVIGSYEELQERAVEGWDEFVGHSPHRPYVDRVKIRNPNNGNLMSRVPDVGNPWLDAGIVPFSTMPAEWFPAEFVTESFPGQFRNWFYALLTMGTMMAGRAPFKTLLGHGLVRDEDGEEMHKTRGNSIEFNGAAEGGFTTRRPLKPNEKNPPAKPDGALAVRVVAGEIDRQACQVVEADYPPIGADVMRWLYCRANPASNINFGPRPADEVRGKFTIKLWNCYAFLCNYARTAAGGFETDAPQLPVKQRPDLDRWILSDLQKLVEVANTAFRDYSVMEFCLETERFIDDKLSNWYIRTSRQRFQRGEAGPDKLAAFQTLYTVMTTLAKLLAPVVPFLAETLWQNLRLASDPESVHLCDYPQADAGLIDAELSDDVAAVMRLVSLGGAARNAGKVAKIRQPLAELRVYPSTDAERRALDRYRDQIASELNVKAVTLAEAPLLTTQLKLNKKTAAAKLGAKLKEAEAALATFDPAQLAARLKAGPVEIVGVPLEAGDIAIDYTAPTGFAGAADGAAQVLIDTRISPALAREGAARDVVRFVQESRKNAGLDMEDRIELHLRTDADGLRQAIAAHRDTIAAETLATRWADAPLDGNAYTGTVKVDGQTLQIGLRRV